MEVDGALRVSVRTGVQSRWLRTQVVGPQAWDAPCRAPALMLQAMQESLRDLRRVGARCVRGAGNRGSSE